MFTLREANPDDRVAVAQTLERAFHPLRDVYRPTRAAVAQKDATSSDYQQFVGVSGDRVVATVEYRLSLKSLLVRALAVDPEFQGRGFARRIIEEMASIARGEARTTITLYTIKETGNVKFFERLGFCTVSEEIASWCESDQFETLHETRMERGVA